MDRKIVIREFIAGTLFYSGAERILRTFASKVFGGYILAYHNTPIKRFIEQIEALHPDKPISLNEMIDRNNNNKSTKGLFSITVDDGYENIVTSYSEICEKKDWPITFFLPTAYMEKKTLPFLIVENLIKMMPDILVELSNESIDLTSSDKRNLFFRTLIYKMYTTKESDYMSLVNKLIEFLINSYIVDEYNLLKVTQPVSWEQVEKYSKLNTVSFQSHGVTHQGVIALDEKELREELIDSKNQIERHTGKSVSHFCYPYGSLKTIGNTSPNIVAEYYKSAFTMIWGRLHNVNNFLLPRIPIFERDSENVTRLKVLTT